MTFFHATLIESSKCLLGTYYVEAQLEIAGDRAEAETGPSCCAQGAACLEYFASSSAARSSAHVSSSG